MTDIDPAQAAPKLEPQQRRSREARARILAAAETLLREDGIDGFSMVAVGKVAEMPVGNIYRRFEGRDDLLQALKDVVALRIREAVVTAVQGGNHCDLESYVTAFASAVGDVFSKDEELHKALFDPRVANRQMLETGQGVRATIFSFFLDGLRKHVPTMTDERLATAARVAFSIITNAAIFKVRGNDPIMTAFSWPEMKTEYGMAASAYVEKAVEHSRPDAERSPQ